MTLFFSKHSLPPKMFSHLQRIRGTWGFSLGSKIRSTRVFSNIFCFGDDLFCWKSIKSWWWMFCFVFWWWFVLFWTLDFWNQHQPIFLGDSSNFPTCCQLVVVKKRMSRFPSLLKKNSERKSCCLTFNSLFPPIFVAGEKKKQSSETPQIWWFDLYIYICIYIYISPPWN